MKPWEILWSLMKPYGALWSPMEPYEALWSPMEPYEALWSPMKPYEPYEALGCPMNPYGILLLDVSAQPLHAQISPRCDGFREAVVGEFAFKSAFKSILTYLPGWETSIRWAGVRMYAHMY